MITHFNHERLEKNLPDAYRKDRDSNNAKILEIEKHTLDQIRKSIHDIYESLDINNAYGKTLDLFGEMVGQRRGMATDEQYRILIKSKIARNNANADYNSIIRAICVTFDCEPEDIIFTELDKPCTVTLEGLPISKINESNIDMQTAVAIINAMMPVGVFMESMSFSGTFEFSDTELEYDPEKGFGDVGQTVGGYLGLVSDGFANNLPV